jgi:ribosomal protein S18 acetylase RimI-like enzyme
MIKISKATNKDSLDKEWELIDLSHYGKKIKWNEKKFSFKATENKKTIGLISGKYSSGVVYVSTIITAESARGKGVGTILVNKVEEFGKKFDAHKIWLITGKEWSENIFYKKVGFKKIGEISDFYYHKDFVVYSKSIK